MRFVANPNFRKGKPKLDEIRFLYIKESNVAFQAYKKGELELAAVAAEDLKSVESDPVLKNEFV